MRGSTALLASLLIASAANADTFLLTEQVDPRFEIQVTASDGLNTSTDSVVLTDPFAGSVVATLQGILNPEFLGPLAILAPQAKTQPGTPIPHKPGGRTWRSWRSGL